MNSYIQMMEENSQIEEITRTIFNDIERRKNHCYDNGISFRHALTIEYHIPDLDDELKDKIVTCLNICFITTDEYNGWQAHIVDDCICIEVVPKH